MNAIPPEEYALYWARRLADRAARHLRLAELNAPAYILASERKLLFEAVMRLPADAQTLSEMDAIKDEGQRQVDDFLHKNGFFKDIEGG